MLDNLRGKLLASVAFGVVVVVVLMAYADFSHIAEAFARFKWSYLPAILALTTLNYLLRFVKWDYYLRLVGARDVGKLDSFLLFFSGLSMVMTPGKVGEWLKSYLLREISGIPISRSAPIIMAERLTDGIAMLLLALGGFLVFQVGWEVMVAGALLAPAAVVATQHRPFALRLLALGERLPLLARRMDHLRAFYESSYLLFSPTSLLVAVALGFISWAGECVAFYLVLQGLGLPGGWMLVVQASFILAVSTLAGSMLLVPGGLGVAEGGLTALAQLLLGMPKDAAAAAALLIRFCTLWFGVAVGVAALSIFVSRRSSRKAAADAQA